ncbi:577_t:CDS:2, partial [Funneliformis geosporum]
LKDVESVLKSSVQQYPYDMRKIYTFWPNLLRMMMLLIVIQYQPAGFLNVQYHFNVEETCNVELWDTDFYPESHDYIIP